LITLIDYGLGNIKAFSNIYNRLGIPCKNATNYSDLDDATHLILPGVGAFDYAMDKLNLSGMREKLDELVLEKKIPIIGICVGMQIMANGSEEGNLEGLGWYDTEVVKFVNSSINLPLPHMGWNSIDILSDNQLFNNLNKEKRFYFLHSYHFKSSFEYTIATSSYSNSFTTVTCKENIFGIQCHPEKSHLNGTKLLKNFSEV
jgi:glutamine amidotransferase